VNKHTLRATILLAATITASGGCQPKANEPAASATTRASAREPLHRVEVMSRSSSQLAESVVGRKCRVQIRRDALGMAGNAPLVQSGRWASETAIDGTIIEMSDQWLVVQAPGKRVVIPYASVLTIELQD
jgi:hypothetical protein